MKQVVFDVETDGFNPTVIWCLVVYELDTGKWQKFVRPDLRPAKFKKYALTVDRWICHNGIKYDVPVIEKLIGRGIIDRAKVVDTLILSWLENYERPGGHSLENWGTLLQSPKIEFNDFSRFTLEMLDYCTQDVALNARMYERLFSQLQEDHWKKAIDLEHQVQWICLEMNRNGFAWNYDEALTLAEEIQAKIAELDAKIQNAFLRRSVRCEPSLVRVKKDGSVSRTGLGWYEGDISKFAPEAEYCRLVFEEFNPGSPKQVVERLHEAGWRPTEKTKGHIDAEKLRPSNPEERAQKKEKLEHFRKYGWKVNETNVGTLPEDAPEGARALVEHMLHSSRLRTLTEWFEAYNPDTKRIHGQVDAIGAWTQRKSHRRPNTANIAAEKSLKYSSEKLSNIAKDYGKRMRSLWRAGDGRVLVGTDAEGIQLRILAHYMGDQKFIDALVNGDKKNGTDAHSMNMRLIEADSRDTAKTYIYAKCLGAGMAKQASILNRSIDKAAEANKKFEDGWPRWRWLKEEKIPVDASRGFFQGLDGRIVLCGSEHLMLAGYLQNGESLVMKTANVKWQHDLDLLGIPYWQVGDIHDEWQTETLEQCAEEVGRIQADAIRWAGEQLGVLCPLAGSYSIGSTWYDTH